MSDLTVSIPEENPNCISLVMCDKCHFEQLNFIGPLDHPVRCFRCGFLYGHYSVPYKSYLIGE